VGASSQSADTPHKLPKALHKGFCDDFGENSTVHILQSFAKEQDPNFAGFLLLDSKFFY
jgi:hypothetical protein